MATVTITEILGSDNIAGSRITINSNFTKLANSINTLETYLDTSFTPGAALNVGSALVKKYTRPITDQIFTCEATGLFGGNLNVSQDLGVTRDSVVGRHTTLHGNLNLDGTNGSTSAFTSSIPVSQNAANINPQFYETASLNTLFINPQTLTTPSSTSTARNIVATTSFNKVNTIRLDWSTYNSAVPATNCKAIILPTTNVAQGQIINLLVDYPAPLGTTGTDLELDITNLDPCYTSILFNNNLAPALVEADDTRLRQAAITLYYDTTGWRILNYVGVTVEIS